VHPCAVCVMALITACSVAHLFTGEEAKRFMNTCSVCCAVHTCATDGEGQSLTV
jgi:hypothetical protein